MKDQDQVKAIASLAGHPEPHKPTEEEIKTGSYYQFEPAYLTSRDSISAVIEKQDYYIKRDICLMHTNKLDAHPDAGINLLISHPKQLCEALLKVTGKWVEE